MNATQLKIMGRYLDTVAACGPDHANVIALRRKHGHDSDFIAFADRIDGLKRKVGGKGIDSALDCDSGLCAPVPVPARA